MPTTIAKTQTGIGRQAKIWGDNGHFSVQLYSTVVYDETPETITLKNGGWVTPTTARYMNQALQHRGIAGTVLIHKGEMFFQYNVWKAGKPVCRYPFVNGVFVIKR